MAYCFFSYILNFASLKQVLHLHVLQTPCDRYYNSSLCHKIALSRIKEIQACTVSMGKDGALEDNKKLIRVTELEKA